MAVSPSARGPMQGNPAVGVWPAATPGLFSRQLSRSMSASIMSVAGEGYAGSARNGWELSPFTGMPLAIRAGRPRLSYPPCQPPPPPTFPPPKQPPGPHTLVCPPRGLVPVRLAALPNSKTTSSTAFGRRGSRCRHSSTYTQRLPGLPFWSTRFNQIRPSSPACGTGPTLFLTSSIAVLARTAWKPGKSFRRSQGPSGPGPVGCRRPKDSCWFPTISRVRTEPTGWTS